MNSTVTPEIVAPGRNARSSALKKHRSGNWFKRHWRITIGLSLLGCMAGVGLISWFVLIHNSLRLDESQSLWQTSHSFGYTLRVVANDVHVPLYHVILHFWQLYFGNGVAVSRLLSLIFFLITIPVFYILARQVLRIRWALFASVLFSFAPFMNWYANEARMYTLLALMATLSQLYFIKIIRGKRFAWRGYGIISVIGAYSHYFFSFNLASQGIFLLFNRKRFAPGSIRRYITVGIFVGIALAPWLIYFHSLGSAKNTSPNLPVPTTVDFFNAFSQFLFGFQDNFINTILVSCWPIVILLAFFGIKRGQKLPIEVSYLISAAIIPLLIAYLLSFVVNPFYLSRYMISCVAPLIIVIVWLISHYGRRLATIVGTVFVITIIATSTQQAISSATPVKEDYKDVAAQIDKQITPSDLVVLSAPFTIYPFEYYYNGPAQISTLPIWDRHATGAIPGFSESTLPTQVSQLNQNHHYIYLVLSQDQGYEENIRQYYLGHFKEVSHKVYSPDLSLYVFQVGYTQVPTLGSPQTIIKPTSNAQ